MNASEKIKVKEFLLKEKAKLESRIEDLKELTQPVEPDSAIGRVSRMDAIVNSAVNKEALYKLTEKLSKVNTSLSKLNDRDFGLCIRCGNEIPIQRLLFAPGSFCVSCTR